VAAILWGGVTEGAEVTPPWRARRLQSAYVVEAKTGTPIADIYFRQRRGRRMLSIVRLRGGSPSTSPSSPILSVPVLLELPEVAFVPKGDGDISVDSVPASDSCTNATL
jgi:hypothetical protein